MNYFKRVLKHIWDGWIDCMDSAESLAELSNPSLEYDAIVKLLYVDDFFDYLGTPLENAPNYPTPWKNN